MMSAGLRVTYRAVEIVVSLLLIALCGVILDEAMRLGPGWGEQGPQPGFFPFVMAVALAASAIIILIGAIRTRYSQPFFEVREEIADLLKVGIPMAAAFIAVRWLGLYITAGIYIGLFALWYGRFRWHQALLAALLLPVLMYLVFRHGFNLPMPQSVWYGRGLPI